MIFFYRILINFVFIISPIIILIRLFKKKENIKRFKEKLCFFSKGRARGKLIWFHGASVGEIQSIIPLIEKIAKNNKVRQILITSNTLSSSKIIEKLNIKKVVHQFFPIDTNFLTRKFINYWRPSSVFFIDSEIWPNMILNLEKDNIKINLINGRITKKTFIRWKRILKFSDNIFSKFNLCIASSSESKKYLQNLGVKKVKFIGNLKFSQSEQKIINIDNKFKKFISKKKVWCASSTHNTEELFCGLVHKELKKKYKNLFTLIIPRHIERISKIENELEKLNLKIHKYTSDKKINKNTDIYIVNTYGKTKTFYNYCKMVFLGGSIINHGGQSPLEATRFGCNILHGPNISNFKEIYSFLKRKKISQKITNQRQMINALDSLFKKRLNSKKIQKKFNLIGKKILDTTYKEIKLII